MANAIRVLIADVKSIYYNTCFGKSRNLKENYYSNKFLSKLKKLALLTF